LFAGDGRGRIEAGLGIEDVPDADGAVHRLACHGEDLGHQVEGLFAGLQPRAERFGLLAQLRVGQRTDVRLELADRCHHAQVALDHALIAGAEELASERAEDGDAHGECSERRRGDGRAAKV